MRRVSRFIFTFVMTIPMVAATSLLIEGFRDKPAPALVFAAAGIAILSVSLKYGYRKEDRIIFWLGAFPLALASLVVALIGGVYGVTTFFSRMFLGFIKYFVCGVGFVFWYWVSTRIFKLSRDEELRARETPSETELRRAHECRDPALDAAEREYYEKMLASMPESEREALLKKQKAWEEQHKCR